jgi:hypothetical protein
MNIRLIFGVAFAAFSIMAAQTFAQTGNEGMQPIDQGRGQALGETTDRILEDARRREFAERINNRGFVERMNPDAIGGRTDEPQGLGR